MGPPTKRGPSLVEGWWDPCKPSFNSTGGGFPKLTICAEMYSVGEGFPLELRACVKSNSMQQGVLSSESALFEFNRESAEFSSCSRVNSGKAIAFLESLAGPKISDS